MQKAPSSLSLAPCVLLDRDGTVIHNRHYLADPDGVELLPGAVEGLTLLHGLGCPLVMLTNQSGIGRGYFGPESVDAVHRRLGDMLAAHGIALDGIFFCPHAPEDACACRKPAQGLFLQAAAALPALHLAARRAAGRVVMVGDSLADLALGHALGGKAVLVRTGGGAALAERFERASGHPALNACAGDAGHAGMGAGCTGATAAQNSADAIAAGRHPSRGCCPAGHAVDGCPPPHYAARDLADAARWIATAFALPASRA